MGEFLLLIRDAVLMGLGGYTPGQMKSALLMANEIGDIAGKGKYKSATRGVHDAIRIGVKIRQLRHLTAQLFPELAERKGYVFIRRKPGVREVEIVHRPGEGRVTVVTGEIVDKTCPRGLLGTNTGFAE